MDSLIAQVSADKISTGLRKWLVKAILGDNVFALLAGTGRADVVLARLTIGYLIKVALQKTAYEGISSDDE
jgi:hypothetical protein